MQAGQLAENISKIIDVQFSDNVDMSSVQVTIEVKTELLHSSGMVH
jgi:hypothetical protein